MQHLTQLTGKEQGEIEDILDDMAQKGILTLRGGDISAFHEEMAWRSLRGHHLTP